MHRSEGQRTFLGVLVLLGVIASSLSLQICNCCIKAFVTLLSLGKNVTAEIRKWGLLQEAAKVFSC